jgi:serine/threonine protein kinase
MSFEDHGITFTGAIQLADFGSGFLSVDGGTSKTRWDVKAPERLKCDLERFEGNAWGLPADIWALGCTVLELVTGSVFFQGPGKIPWRMWTDKTFVGVVEKTLENLEHELRAFLRVHARSDMTNAEPTAVEKLIKGMLRGTPENRLMIDDVQIDWEELV